MSSICTEISPPSSGRLSWRHEKLSAMAHRQARSVPFGPCMRLTFEDEWTVGYQVAEVLRAERVSSSAGWQQELAAYAHLLPDGSDWKATLMIELPDAAERLLRLPHLNEAVHGICIEVAGHPAVLAEANEDLADRHTMRLSAVHFLRFPLTSAVREALHDGADATLACDHPHYRLRETLPVATLEQLRRTLRPPAAGASLFERFLQHQLKEPTQ